MRALTGKRRKKGFTLIELIIVIAVLAILAAILIPSMIGYMENAQETICLSNMETVMRSYLSMYAKEYAKDSSADKMTVLRDTVANVFPSAKMTGDKITDVCPNGGEYTCELDMYGSMWITCDKHGTTTEVTPEKAMKTLVGLDSVENYFAKKGIGSTLDSSATHAGAIAPEVTKELSKLLHMDMTKQSWRVVKTAGGNYDVYWTSNSVNDNTSGDTVTTYKYDTKTGACVKGTAKVGRKSATGTDGKTLTYNVIDSSTFVED